MYICIVIGILVVPLTELCNKFHAFPVAFLKNSARKEQHLLIYEPLRNL